MICPVPDLSVRLLLRTPTLMSAPVWVFQGWRGFSGMGARLHPRLRATQPLPKSAGSGPGRGVGRSGWG